MTKRSYVLQMLQTYAEKCHAENFSSAEIRKLLDEKLMKEFGLSHTARNDYIKVLEVRLEWL